MSVDATGFGIASCFVSFVFPNSPFWMIIVLDAERDKCFPTAQQYFSKVVLIGSKPPTTE
jgi:hypothetical protein